MPPALDRAIAVPTAAVAGVPVTVNDEDDVAAVKVNLAVPVCVPWPAVAVTAHVPAADAVSDVPDTLHPVVAVE